MARRRLADRLPGARMHPVLTEAYMKKAPIDLAREALAACSPTERATLIRELGGTPAACVCGALGEVAARAPGFTAGALVGGVVGVLLGALTQPTDAPGKGKP